MTEELKRCPFLLIHGVEIPLNKILNFMLQVGDKTEHGCMEWKGGIMHRGYGHWGFSIEGKRYTFRAHRTSYELFIGPITDGALVCHFCDNRKCVNPEHLFLGTPKENMDDKKNKGRCLSGTRIYNSRLNPSSVRIIRQLFKGGMSQAEIARKYGVAQATVYSVVRNKTWKDVK